MCKLSSAILNKPEEEVVAMEIENVFLAIKAARLPTPAGIEVKAWQAVIEWEKNRGSNLHSTLDRQKMVDCITRLVMECSAEGI